MSEKSPARLTGEVFRMPSYIDESEDIPGYMIDWEFIMHAYNLVIHNKAMRFDRDKRYREPIGVEGLLLEKIFYVLDFPIYKDGQEVGVESISLNTLEAHRFLTMAEQHAGLQEKLGQRGDDFRRTFEMLYLYVNTDIHTMHEMLRIKHNNDVEAAREAEALYQEELEAQAAKKLRVLRPAALSLRSFKGYTVDPSRILAAHTLCLEAGQVRLAQPYIIDGVPQENGGAAIPVYQLEFPVTCPSGGRIIGLNCFEATEFLMRVRQDDVLMKNFDSYSLALLDELARYINDDFAAMGKAAAERRDDFMPELY